MCRWAIRCYLVGSVPLSVLRFRGREGRTVFAGVKDALSGRDEQRRERRFGLER